MTIGLEQYRDLLLPSLYDRDIYPPATVTIDPVTQSLKIKQGEFEQAIKVDDCGSPVMLARVTQAIKLLKRNSDRWNNS